MADQEVNVEKSGEFQSLGSFGKTISTIGWGVVGLGLVISLYGLYYATIGRGEIA